MFCSELKRHLKTKHPEAYKKVEITDRKSLKLQRESVNEGKRIQQQIVDLKEKFEVHERKDLMSELFSSIWIELKSKSQKKIG